MLSKILNVILVFMLSYNLHAHSATDASKVLEGPDEYVEAFIHAMNNKKVCYEKNALSLYAETPASIIATFALLAGICGIGGLVALKFGHHLNNNPTLCSIGYLYLGMTPLFAWASTTDLCGKSVYFLINEQGFRFVGKRFIPWSEVANICLDNNTYVHNNTSVHINGISLGQGTSQRVHKMVVTDRFRSVLLEIEEEDRFLPIPLNNLIAVFEHYYNKYRDRVVVGR